MGEVKVPEEAYFGAQTQRAIDNFPVSGYRFPRAFFKAIGLVKKAAAQVNEELGKLPSEISEPIQQAAEELSQGKFDADLPVDIFQTGSGTSTHMNVNEVIANRAIEITGGEIGDKSIHPNDHVNMGQSSNDVIPTSVHLSVLDLWHNELEPHLQRMEEVLDEKQEEFQDVVKIGRTHLQDATPVTLGQEFSGYRTQVSKAIDRLDRSAEDLTELALGGTAVGTGLNTHPEFAERVCGKLREWVDLPLKEAPNHFEAQAGRDALVEFSGSLKTVAVSMMKIGNDLRWLSSGPRCGIGEMKLPAVQPGSSIMPGKVNPVLPESITQVAAQIIGNDSTVSVAGQSGNFELNVMIPVIAYNVLESIRLLSGCVNVLTEKCLKGIEANEEQCEEYVRQSLALCTSLATEIGYDQAAEIAKEAYKSGKTVRQVAEEQEVLPSEQLDELLDPETMLEPDVDSDS